MHFLSSIEIHLLKVTRGIRTWKWREKTNVFKIFFFDFEFSIQCSFHRNRNQQPNSAMMPGLSIMNAQIFLVYETRRFFVIFQKVFRKLK